MNSTHNAAVRSRAESIRSILKVVSGNFLEQFDFFLFGFYATHISETFFSAGDGSDIALLKTYGVFAASFFMRPLGAVILGAYIDRAGRKKGLLLTLMLMAVGTMVIALTPSYASIGLIAPVLIVLARLIQGFSAGVELGGVSVYLSEIATPGRRGFYVSWQSASQQVSVIFASVLGLIIGQIFSKAEIAEWAWRIPFIVGCLIIPLIFFLRRRMKETEEFVAKAHKPAFKEAIRVLWKYKRLVLCGMLLVAMTTTTFYFTTIYTPTFVKKELGFTENQGLLLSMMIALSNFIWLPIGGALADLIGRKPLMIAATVLIIVLAYPAMRWLTAGQIQFSHAVIVLLFFSFCFGIYNGGTVVALTEIMPPIVKASGFSMAYSLATATFGGVTPLLSTWLIAETGSRSVLAFWLMFAAACALAATLWVYSKNAQVYRERLEAKS